MANVFDEIHADAQAEPKAAGGNVFDQIHAESQPKAAPGFLERMGSTIKDTLKEDMGNVRDFFGGVGAGAASTGVGAYNLARKLPGLDDLPAPNAYVQKVATAPDNAAGKIGEFAEKGAEFALPLGAVGDAVKAAPLAVKTAAKMATAGGIGAVQSGGDPTAIALAAGGEGALSLGGAAISAGKRALLDKVVNDGPRPLSDAAIEMANKYGIPLSKGTQGGSRFLQATEKILGSTVAPGPYQDMLVKGQSGMKAATTDLAGGFNTDQFSAGDSTLKSLISHSSEHEHDARVSYDALAKFEADPANIQNVQTGTRPALPAGASTLLDASGRPVESAAAGTIPVMEQMGLPVDTTAQKAALQPIRDRIMRQLPFAQQQQSRGLKAIQNILDGPDMVPASVAEENLSALKTIQREAVDGKTKALAGAAIDAANPGIEAAVAKAGPDATDALMTGRSAWKEHAKTIDLVDELAGDTSGKEGQTKVARRLLQPADASYPALEKVLQAAPDAAPALRQAFLGQVFKKAETGEFTNPTQAANLWNQIGKRTKAALFTPEHIADVNAALELGARLAENPNPSGTGTINAMLKMGLILHNPVAGAASFVFGRGLAKVLFAPEGAAALRSALENPAGATKALGTVKGILGDAGDAAKKLMSDESGGAPVKNADGTYTSAADLFAAGKAKFDAAKATALPTIEDVATKFEDTFDPRKKYAVRALRPMVSDKMAPGSEIPKIGARLPRSWHPAEDQVEGYTKNTRLDGTAGFDLRDRGTWDKSIQAAVNNSYSYFPDVKNFALIEGDGYGAMDMPEDGGVLIKNAKVKHVFQAEHKP